MKAFTLVPKNFSSDREFLPSALEVMESPPSPVGISLLYAIAALFIMAFIWSFIGKLDVIASSTGKIQPQGNVKVVESLVTGKIDRILVQNGDWVEQGQILATLDPSELNSQFIDASTSLASYKAETLRRQKENMLVSGISLANPRVSTNEPIVWNETDAIDESIKQRETTVMEGELSKLNSDLQNILAQIAQNASREMSARNTIASQQSLIETLSQRMGIRKALVAKQFVSQDDWLQVMSSVKEARGNLVSAQSQLADTISNKAILEAGFIKTRDDFVANNLQQLVTAERQVSTLTQKEIEAKAQLDHMILRAPISGTVAASSLTTIGQVVSSGNEIMRVVPDGATMEVIAYVPNQEIGFIREGQHVDIKVDAFPFTRYGTIDGSVIKISQDAIPTVDAQQSQIDPTHINQISQKNSGGSQATQNLVYPLTIKLKENHIMIDGRSVNLVPGMGITAEIKTDKRRLIDYLISPVYDMATSSLHER
jgi:hemolysin D